MPHRPETTEQLRAIARNLHTAAGDLVRLSTDDILRCFEAVGRTWRPPLPAGPFGSGTVVTALGALASALTADHLRPELARELGRADLLDSWAADESRTGLVRGYPLGVVAQVLAGNVFLGGAIALAQTLLTRNAALLKLSRDDAGFTEPFAAALSAADTRLASAIAVCAWDSARDDLNQVLRDEADAVVVWGGQAAIEGYPAERCRGRVIHYGPRLGVGVWLGTDAADRFAWDVAVWEQRACSSPRLIFVAGDPSAAARQLSAALAAVRAKFPAQPLSLDEKSEVLSLRELADWSGAASVVHATASMDHTVIVHPHPPEELPLGYRTVVLVPLPDLERLPELLAPYRGMLQTAALAAPAEQWPAAADVLVRAGFTQVSAAGSAASRALGLPHEGEYALRRLVKLVGIDLGAGPLAHPNTGAAAVADALTGPLSG